MGTWGPGNFEDDGARDHLLLVMQRLQQDVEACFAGTGMDELDVDIGDGDEGKSNYVAIRRQVVVETFDRLYNLADDE